MSIDKYNFVPAGARNKTDAEAWRHRYKNFAEMKVAVGTNSIPHQVFLAQGASEDALILIDEQFFDCPEDARWFWDKRYKGTLYLGEIEPYHMVLWIDGRPGADTTSCW